METFTYVMFYCGFYSVDVAVAFLNHFLTVGRHGVNVCRILLLPTELHLRQNEGTHPTTHSILLTCPFYLRFGCVSYA
jgi:hypothetical protein